MKMTVPYLFDTDVLIDYLRSHNKAVVFLEQAIKTASCAMAAISVAELYAGIREGDERMKLEQFLSAFELIPINEVIAKQGGLYRRQYHRSHGVGLADGIIAATADHLNAQLVTLNKKHFPMLRNIKTPYQK